MKLSVIIPGFGGRAALAKAQAGRLRTLDADGEWEVIVAEGSSVGSARNNGLAQATGDWIAWVDADDEVAVDWAQTIVHALRDCDRDGVDVVTWDYEMTGSGRTIPCRYGADEILSGGRFLEDVLREERQHCFLWNKLIRRSLWEGLRFDESVQVLEDFLLLPRVLSRARNVRYLSRVLYRYHQGDDSLIHRDLRQWTETSFALALRRIRELGNRPAAVLGACMLAYFVVEKETLGRDVGDCRAQKRFLRENLSVAWTDRLLSWRWKLKFTLAGLNVLGVMKWRWRFFADDT